MNRALSFFLSQLQIRDSISVPFHFISVETGDSIHIETESVQELLPIKSETIIGKNEPV